jgi:ATP-binding cassette, subfamily G (WHITE), member 2, PDR
MGCGQAKTHLLIRNLGILFAFIVSFFIIYLVGADFIPGDYSKGEVLVFHKKPNITAALRRKAADEESGNKSTREATTAPSKASTVIGPDESLGSNTLVHWKDVCYTIDIKGCPRQILDHVTGWIKPGSLTALIVRALAFNFHIPANPRLLDLSRA